MRCSTGQSIPFTSISTTLPTTLVGFHHSPHSPPPFFPRLKYQTEGSDEASKKEKVIAIIEAALAIIDDDNASDEENEQQ